MVLDSFRTNSIDIQDTNITTMQLSDYKAVTLTTLLFLPALSLPAQNTAEIPVPRRSSSPNIYVKAEGGPAFMQDLQVNVGSMEHFKFDTGTRFNLALGTRFTRSGRPNWTAA